MFSTQVNQTTHPEYYTQHQRNSIEDARRLQQLPYTPLQNRRLAAQPNEYRTADNLARGSVGSWSQPFGRAADFITGSGAPISGDDIEGYMSPYRNRVVNRIEELGNRNLNERILPAIMGRYVSAGAYGGGHHRQAFGRAIREAQAEISAQQAQSEEQGYKQASDLAQADRMRQLEAARQQMALGGVQQAANLTDIGTLESIAQRNQQHEQNRLNVENESQRNQEMWPWQQLQRFSHILHGAQVPVSSLSVNEQPPPMQVNMPGNIASMAGQLYGANMAGILGGNNPLARR